MNWYTCAGFRPVRAEGNRDAAEVFAQREAVKRYGKKAVVRILTEKARSQDGRIIEWDAFLGLLSRSSECTGHNFHLMVTKRNH